MTVRLNQPLSSDHNQVGDVFSASLDQPVTVLGIVVAPRGQTVIGHVVEAKKAGRVHGVSRLGITLTDLNLVDGQTVAIQSQFLVRKGPTSRGRDAAVIAGTTGVGAAIGAGVDGGTGAAVGAAAGAAAGTIGVLLTSLKFLGDYGSFFPACCQKYLIYWCADKTDVCMSHFM